MNILLHTEDKHRKNGVKKHLCGGVDFSDSLAGRKLKKMKTLLI